MLQDFVSDSGTAPNVDGGFGGGRTGIPTPDAAIRSQVEISTLKL